VSLSLAASVRSDVGHVRSGNEDSAFAGPRLVAVADGMGGHAAGEVASHVAISALAPLDEDAAGADLLGTMRDALADANERLRSLVAADGQLSGMGTTLTALLSAGRRLALLHIGDSRGYLLRDGELTRITRDHTYVQDLIDAGTITGDEAASHPQRSVITRTLDGSDMEPDLRVREAVAGDRYLLCSDGLTDVVSENTLREVLCEGTAQEAVDRLVDLALRAGGPDNVTAVVADVVEHEVETPPQVAGAAAVADTLPSARSSLLSAAGRAAMMRRRPGRDGSESAPAATAQAAGRAGLRARLLRPLVLIPTAVVVLLAAAAFGGWLYLSGQWYVGADDTDVVVYHGVPGSVAGLHLHSRDSTRGALADLTEGDRQRVQEGIPAHDRGDAERIVTALQRIPDPDATPPAPTAPAPTPPAPAPPAPTPPAPTPPAPTPPPTPPTPAAATP